MRGGRRRKASLALDDGLKIFQARIRAAGEPADPTEVTYLDEKNKFTDADKNFSRSCRRNMGRTKPGQMAQYYAALSEVQLKNYPDAEKNLVAGDLRRRRNSGEPGQISIGLSLLAGK